MIGEYDDFADDLDSAARTFRKSLQRKKQRETKATKAAFFRDLPQLFSNVHSEKELVAVISDPGFRQNVREIDSVLKVKENAVKLSTRLQTEKHEQSAVYAPLVVHLTDKVDPVVVRRDFNEKPKRVKDMRKDCEKRNRLERVQGLKQASSSPGRYPITFREAELTREWVSKQLVGESGTSTFKCNFSRKRLCELYFQVGAVKIFCILADSDEYKDRVATFKETKDTPKKCFIRSLYLAKKWRSQGFAGPRPKGLWARERRSFWKMINAWKRVKLPNGTFSNSKYMKIWFSTKIHPCDVCMRAPEIIKMSQRLIEMYDKSQDGAEKGYIKERLEVVLGKIKALEEHKEKNMHQRKQLQEVETLIDKGELPGVVLVYEDFASRYQADGSKLMNLIHTLVYWCKEKKKKVIRFFNSFSKGSLTPEQTDDPNARGKQDRYIYRESWLELFRQGVFDDFHTIIKSGDNGASLKNYGTFYMAGMIWRNFFKRIIFFTLCPGHAFNRCDPQGGRTNRVIEQKEREIGKQLANHHVAAALLNERKLKNVVKSFSLTVLRKGDEYMPDNLLGKDDQPIGIQDVAVAYFETVDIFYHVNPQKGKPIRTIRLLGLGMVAHNGASGKVAYLCVRPGAKDVQQVCQVCTQVFARLVLLEEHDQSSYFLCPSSNVLAYETKESLNRVCPDCSKVVSESHIQGQKRDCPSIGLDPQTVRPKTFPARTIDGRIEDLQIIYHADFQLTRERILELDLWYQKKVSVELDKKAEAIQMLIPTMTAIFRTHDKEVALHESLPWGIGDCVEVDRKNSQYELLVYKMKEKEYSSVWNLHVEPGTLKIRIPFSCPLISPVSLGTKKKKTRKNAGLIPTETIFQITDDVRFNWAPPWAKLIADPDPAPVKIPSVRSNAETEETESESEEPEESESEELGDISDGEDEELEDVMYNRILHYLYQTRRYYYSEKKGGRG